MAKAFVLEPCKNDVSKAEQFGEIIFLYPEGERRVSIWDDDFTEGVLAELEYEKFCKVNDFFVIVGNMAPMIMIAGALVGEYGHFDALIFDSLSRKYVVKILGIDIRNP